MGMARNDGRRWAREEAERARGGRRGRNALGRTLEASGDTTLDSPAKRILSWSPVLARVIKYSLDEFDGATAEEVERALLDEGRVWVSERPLHMEDEAEVRAEPEHSLVGGLSSVDETLGEGAVRYDILADVPVPGSAERDVLVVNVEPQRDHSDVHYVLRRALYYVGRMISAQRGRVFGGDDYAGLRKVASVWVLPYPPAGLRGTLLSYELRQDVLCGEGSVARRDFDLVQVVLVCLDPHDPDAGAGNPLMSLTGALFCEKMELHEREQRLADHGITLDEQAREDLGDMGSMADAIGEWHYQEGLAQGREQGLAQGREQGLEQGLEQGREEGLEQGLEQAARALMAAQGLTPEAALDLLGVEPAQRERVLASLSAR